MDNTTIDSTLDSLFDTAKQSPGVPTQRSAIRNALINNMVIISGGPGTGKTYCTSLIKSVFTTYAEQKNLDPPKIISLAPTGKAASKMKKGTTIHSVLRPFNDKPGFYYNKDNMLQTDMVIIDEASMVDIALMTRLLEAIPVTSKIILIGDKNQLSSVEAGSVFSEICKVQGLSHLFFNLEYNYRSKGKTGIENLSKAIITSNFERVRQILESNEFPDVRFLEPDPGISLEFLIQDSVKEGYLGFFNEADPLKSIELIDSFRILCAHNKGEYGTNCLNETCENILRSQHNSDIEEAFFKKAVMIRSNDYQKGLFNGDTGIVIQRDGILTAAFKGLENDIVFWRYVDLPAHETAFAITVHKSQGSEFDTVLIMIPEKISPVLTRQLLYTGVTRARKKVTIIGHIEVIKQALAASIDRKSGLSFYLENSLKQKTE